MSLTARPAGLLDELFECHGGTVVCRSLQPDATVFAVARCYKPPVVEDSTLRKERLQAARTLDKIRRAPRKSLRTLARLLHDE
jgi:hypothetical protein